MLTPYFLIGEVLKPHGIHGEAKIKPYAQNPEDFLRWQTLYLKEGEGWRPLAAKCSRVHDGFAYVTLGDCRTPEEAEKLRGTQLYIDRAHAAKLPEGMYYIADLIGCRAVDAEEKVIGTLENVLQHGSVDVWVFRTPKGGTMMAPSLPEVFVEKDIENGLIRVDAERLQEVAVYED